MNEQISKFLQTRIDAGDFPSAVYLIAEKGEIVFTDALGYAVVEPELIEATIDTIYDLASVTKVLVTGLIAAKFIEDGRLSLDVRVADILPEFASTDKRELTVQSLFVHDSGLDGWIPFYLLAKRPEELLQTLANKPLGYASGSRVIYSDPNFIAAQFVLEAIGGKRVDEIARDEIFEKLDLRQTFYNPPESIKGSIAANEKGNYFERDLSIELGYLEKDQPIDTRVFRTETIWGEVHDHNAYFMGGVAGHAGLFSTAEEVFKIAQQFLPNYTQLLKPETCELFTTNFTPGMNEDRSFAFQLASTKDSTAGARMSPESFGHNGFTGTSLWIDPLHERVFVLLTNRTHNHELPFVNINSVRRQFHDLGVDLLDKNR